MLLLYVLMGVPAGYSSSVLYKSFKGRQWQQCTLLTALLFPSVCFTVFLSLNLMSQRYHSTQVTGRRVKRLQAQIDLRGSYAILCHKEYQGRTLTAPLLF